MQIPVEPPPIRTGYVPQPHAGVSETVRKVVVSMDDDKANWRFHDCQTPWLSYKGNEVWCRWWGDLSFAVAPPMFLCVNYASLALTAQEKLLIASTIHRVFGGMVRQQEDRWTPVLADKVRTPAPVYPAPLESTTIAADLLKDTSTEPVGRAKPPPEENS